MIPINSGMSAIKDTHLNAIVESLRNRHGRAVSDIAAATGLSIPTVKKAIDYCLGVSIVSVGEIAASTGGRKAQMYEINPAFRFTLYFVLDDNELHYVLKDFARQIREQGARTIELKNFLKEIEVVLQSYIKQYQNISTVCVAVPAIVDSGKIIDWYYNPSFNGFDLRRYFETKHQVGAAVENDMKLTALAAAAHAAEKEDTTLATLQFGHNGIGIGQIVNGKIMRGANGFAGEISYLRESPEEAVSAAYCARVVRAAIVMTNPELLIFYTSKNQHPVEDIMRTATKGLPAYAMPRVMISDDYLQDMLKGLEILSKHNERVIWA